MPEFTTIRSIAFPDNTLEVTDNGEPHASSVYLEISKIHGDEAYIAVPAKELREAIDKAVGPAEGGYRASWLDACREQEETLARVNEVTFQRDTARKHLHDAEARVDELLAAQSRPVTVTDEMVERALTTYRDVLRQHGYVLTSNDKTQEAMSHALRVALTPPPARDPRAEALAADITDWDENVVVRSLSDADANELADHLAALGWTKEGS